MCASAPGEALNTRERQSATVGPPDTQILPLPKGDEARARRSVPEHRVQDLCVATMHLHIGLRRGSRGSET